MIKWIKDRVVISSTVLAMAIICGGAVTDLVVDSNGYCNRAVQFLQNVKFAGVLYVNQVAVKNYDGSDWTTGVSGEVTLTPIVPTHQTTSITAEAGRFYTNKGTTTDIVLTLPANAPDNTQIGFLNESPILGERTNILTGGTASADSELNGSWTAGGALAGGWLSASQIFPHYWIYDAGVGNSDQITILLLSPWADGGGRSIKDFTLYGSNNGTDYTLIYTGVVTVEANEWQEFIVPNNTAYRYNKVIITSNYRGDGVVGFRISAYYNILTRHLTITPALGDTIVPNAVDTSTVLDALGEKLTLYKSGTNWLDTPLIAGAIVPAITIASTSTIVKTDDFNITEADNGKTFSNAGSVKDIKATLADNLPDGFSCRILNEVGSSTTSYTNNGGSGDRTASIAVTTDLTNYNNSITRLVDGLTHNDIDFTSAVDVVGKYIRFQFSEAKFINEARFEQGAAPTASHGTWQWQGSSNGTDWTNIGSTFTLGPTVELEGNKQIQTTLSANTQTYVYYQLLGISGNMSTQPYLVEFFFKIDTALPKGLLTLSPPSGSKLPGTSAINRNLVSLAFGDSLGVYKTANNFIGTSVFPDADNWVDTAQP